MQLITVAWIRPNTTNRCNMSYNRCNIVILITNRATTATSAAFRLHYWSCLFVQLDLPDLMQNECVCASPTATTSQTSTQCGFCSCGPCITNNCMVKKHSAHILLYKATIFCFMFGVPLSERSI